MASIVPWAALGGPIMSESSGGRAFLGFRPNVGRTLPLQQACPLMDPAFNQIGGRVEPFLAKIRTKFLFCFAPLRPVVKC